MSFNIQSSFIPATYRFFIYPAHAGYGGCLFLNIELSSSKIPIFLPIYLNTYKLHDFGLVPSQVVPFSSKMVPSVPSYKITQTPPKLPYSFFQKCDDLGSPLY